MDADEQLELLRRHVPVLRFDARELFFPIAVEPYIATSALVVDGVEVRGPGETTPEMLDHTLDGAYLRFISDADRRSVVREEARRLAGKLLGPRLGRVGYFGRMLDALFLLSVVLRPTTPRLTTVAASLKAERHDLHRSATCYGRVLAVGDWLVLHYAYFYVMNDWRSGYRGVNDHEADWEQAWIYCDPDDLRPVWVAASSHENRGPDLRRHWDDPECMKVGDHPVLYVGAGSHALFYRPGDYVSRIDVPALRWLLRARRWARRTLRIAEEDTEGGLGPALGAPFVDAATGDGAEIDEWDLRHLDERRPCFGAFRGLWGLDTGDPINGERGPAGPKYDREGRIRHAWADPVGFAGLHGASPPSLADAQTRLDNIEAGLDHLEAEIRQTSRLLSLPTTGDEPSTVAPDSARLSRLHQQRTELQDLRRRLLRGDQIDVGIREHLRDPVLPLAPPAETGWILAIWATVSVPLVMLLLAAPILLASVRVVELFFAIVAGFTVFERLVRRQWAAALRLAAFYTLLAGFLGFVSVITISVYAFGGTLVMAAVLLFVGNLGELTAFRRRPEPYDPEPATSGADERAGD